MLRARKVFKNTRILYPTDWGWPSVASVAGINEPGRLKDMYGIELVKIPYAELVAEMEQNLQSQTAMNEAAEMADVVYENSERNFLDKKYVNSSMVFYQSVINTMKKHHCNAFTIECFEFCVSRLPQKWNITPCLTHTLFKDLGIPSACEGDLGGLLVLKGKLADSNGWDEDLRGCSVSAFIVGKESGSAHEFMKKQTDYGNHLCWVYGDFSGQLEKLGQLIGIDVVTVS